MPDCELPLDSLDTSKDFKLRSCRKVDDYEVAVVFVPESRRGVFQSKLDQYLDPDKDGKGGPRNHNLVDSIAEIKLADLQSFWTDVRGLFPQDEDQVVWWELWLKKQPNAEDPLHIPHQFAERINAQLGNTSITFFDSLVVLIRASSRQLSRAPEFIANLEELRRAKETPNVLLRSSPEDPAQSWNALTVGAFTERTTNDDADFEGWSPLAEFGDVASSSRSAVSWGWRKHAPYKPDVVEEGGNRLLSPDSTEVTDADVVSLLTTSGKTAGQLFETNGDTSAACALVSRQAAILMAEYPDYWPETIRALVVHSAEWTTRMSERFELLYDQHSPKLAKETTLRTVGHGVPDLERARYSASHALTLIAQDELQPFFKRPDARASEDPKLHEMHLYQLPWPIEVLQQLPPELEVKLRVTLSYFIEPNPGRRGYRKRYSYQSHGLRFEVIWPGQTLANFRAFINQRAKEETKDYSGPEGDNEGWKLGSQLRTRGSLHSDTWTGSAASLADMHTIAVYPVGGWWKYRTALDRWENSVRFSLIVSIDVPDENVDIYSVVETQIETQVEIEV